MPGTRTYHEALRNQLDETQGLLKIWYSSSNSGTMCAMVSDSVDGSHLMKVSIRRADWQTVWSGSGMFKAYAGGVEVFGAATHLRRGVRVPVDGLLLRRHIPRSAYINKYGSPC